MIVTVLCEWADEPAPLLSTVERQVAEGLPAWRRVEFARARLTARAAAGLATGTVPVGLAIGRGHDGAPEPRAGRRRVRWRLSLSHSHHVTAAAVGPAGMPLGVDVERVDPANEILLAGITGTADALPSTVEPTLVFSCKEAAYKACRGTAARGLAGYPVRLRDGTITVHPRGLPALHAAPSWHAGFVVVTVTGAPAPVEVIRLSPKDMGLWSRSNGM